LFENVASEPGVWFRVKAIDGSSSIGDEREVFAFPSETIENFGFPVGG
jgi:hypothetical protein